MAFAAAFLVILLVVPSAFAAQFPVDWTTGTDYSSWTTKSVNAGDTLVFTYDPSHNVEVVSKSDYQNCASSNAVKTYTGGKTTVTLKEGPNYFICGTPGHCAGGMKLQVNAKASGSSPAPSGSTGTTPSSTSSEAGSSGAPGLSSMAHLIFGLPLAFGTLMAFVC